MTPDERIANEFTQLVKAFNGISGSLERIAILGESVYEKLYPERVPREVVVTHVQSEEERLRESLGLTGEPLDQWTELETEDDLGPRERKLVQKKSD